MSFAALAIFSATKPETGHPVAMAQNKACKHSKSNMHWKTKKKLEDQRIRRHLDHGGEELHEAANKALVKKKTWDAFLDEWRKKLDEKYGPVRILRI